MESNETLVQYNGCDRRNGTIRGATEVCMYVYTAKHCQMSIRNTRVSAYTIVATRGSALCITLL